MDARNFTHEERERAISEICDRISAGESARAILATGRPEHLPSFMIFLQWMSQNEVWAKQYAQAMETRAELMFDEILDIADDSSSDTIIDSEGNERLNTEFVQRSRLKVDTRKWILSRMNPKKYGDRIMTEDVTVKPKELVIIKPK